MVTEEMASPFLSWLRVVTKQYDSRRTGEDSDVECLVSTIRSSANAARVIRQPAALTLSDHVYHRVIDEMSGSEYRALLAGERNKLRLLFVPLPPLRVSEVADISKRKKPVGVVDYYDPRLFLLPRLKNPFDVIGLETWSACDADDGCSLPDSPDDTESVERETDSSGEDFFVDWSSAFVSVGPAGLASSGPAVIISATLFSTRCRACAGVAQKTSRGLNAPTIVTQRTFALSCTLSDPAMATSK